MNYDDLINSKKVAAAAVGFKPHAALNVHLFDWQRSLVSWAVSRGRAALFAECGLGKTLMQLEWARHVVLHTGGSVMLHCPVGVREQTAAEAEKFSVDVDVAICDSAADVPARGIAIVNFEKLHKFDPSMFTGVVLDESSILKNFNGKMRKRITDGWASTPYRLACTATPAPNDHVELCNHSEFLGVMSQPRILSRWFLNDTANTGTWRLKGHAERDFWDWVSTWAVCITKPSDAGGSDDGYELPPLNEHLHVVDYVGGASEGMLFDNFSLSATNVHTQKRNTTAARAERVAEIVRDDEPWIVWCDTNYEADALAEALPSAIEVRGSDSEKVKSQKLKEFSQSKSATLITKPSVAGFGMNWQHCNKMAFIGLSYSFESYYQAVRRCWRFGQQKPVDVHVIECDGESAMRAAVEEKTRKYKQMTNSMASALSGRSLALNSRYSPTVQMEVPSWVA